MTLGATGLGSSTQALSAIYDLAMLDLDGVVYVVSGGGGRATRSVGAGSLTAFSEAVLHFLYVEVTRQTLTLHAIDGVGREFDQAVVRHL